MPADCELFHVDWEAQFTANRLGGRVGSDHKAQPRQYVYILPRQYIYIYILHTAYYILHTHTTYYILHATYYILHTIYYILYILHTTHPLHIALD